MLNKNSYTLFIILLVSMLIVGCSSQKSYDQGPETAAAEESVEYDSAESELKLAEDMPQRNENQKLIYRANISIEVLQKLEPLIQSMQSFVDGHNGYVESMEQYRNGYDPITQEQLDGLYMVIRIPHEHYNKTLQTISELGTVVNKSSSVEDVTLQYSDIESTLKMYKVEQERLLEMIENETTDIKDMIEIEKRLSEVRVELEKQESARRALESQINYDTIELEMIEVRRASDINSTRTFGDRIKATFMKSIDKVIVVSQNLVLSLTFMLIPLSIVALIIGLSYIIFSKIRKYSRNKKDKSNTTDENNAD